MYGIGSDKIEARVALDMKLRGRERERCNYVSRFLFLSDKSRRSMTGGKYDGQAMNLGRQSDGS
jgi:hypothetical protein